MKIEPRLFDELKKVLADFGDRYFVGEELNRSKLSEDLRNYDETLLEKLFQTDFIKQHFIKEVAGQKLFQIEQLEEAILYNDYWDTSYTKYENRIGLASNGKFLEECQDVVLDFPFKDGVLTASMTKEDNEYGYDDAFLNEVIEKDEIDRLFDKKIFVNSKRYDENGDSVVTEFNEDTDNLIIKGNNLLALHAIRDKYAGKVKLIYIDPPYNTGQEDSFAYNDNFKLSAWLVFIKNRLQISKELLREDGIITVSISEKYAAFLEVLMHEVFGSKNHITNFIWEKKKKPSFLSKVGGITETIIAFAKNIESAPVLTYGVTTKGKKYPFNNAGNGIKTLVFPKGTVKFNISDRVVFPQDMSNGNIYTKLLDEVIIKDGFNLNEFRLEGEWRYSQERLNQIIKNKEEIVISAVPFRPNHVKKGGEPKKMHNLLDRSHYSIGTYEDATSEASKLFDTSKFNYTKPEKLINILIEATTDKNDIVLDFFMGSATTQAVAMKMNRRFIGIEQMDYINEVSVPRLQKVIAGEQGGISTNVNWQGGGSFVYTELMPKNMGYLQDIIHAKTLDDLKVVYNRMLEGTDTMEPADISFRADLDKIDWLEGFNENKRLLIKLLDKNGLYYNYSEIDDANVRELISDEDYRFNKQFYKGGE